MSDMAENLAQTTSDQADPAAAVSNAGGMSAYMAAIGAIIVKDLRTEARTKETLGTMIAFAVLAVIVFGLAFDLRVPDAASVAPGVLWVVLLFTGIIGLNRVFGAELLGGGLEALLMAPVDRSAIYIGKLIAQLVFMLIMEAVILPLMLIIFDVNLFHSAILVALLLGALGYLSVGVLFAALTVNTRARESMLPILLLPVMIPVFVAGVGLTSNVLDGRQLSDYVRWLLILGVYDLVFIVIAYIVFDIIWEGV